MEAIFKLVCFLYRVNNGNNNIAHFEADETNKIIESRRVPYKTSVCFKNFWCKMQKLANLGQEKKKAINLGKNSLFLCKKEQINKIVRNQRKYFNSYKILHLKVGVKKQSKFIVIKTEQLVNFKFFNFISPPFLNSNKYCILEIDFDVTIFELLLKLHSSNYDIKIFFDIITFDKYEDLIQIYGILNHKIRLQEVKEKFLTFVNSDKEINNTFTQLLSEDNLTLLDLIDREECLNVFVENMKKYRFGTKTNLNLKINMFTSWIQDKKLDDVIVAVIRLSQFAKFEIIVGGFRIEISSIVEIEGLTCFILTYSPDIAIYPIYIFNQCKKLVEFLSILRDNFKIIRRGTIDIFIKNDHQRSNDLFNEIKAKLENSIMYKEKIFDITKLSNCIDRYCRISDCCGIRLKIKDQNLKEPGICRIEMCDCNQFR